MKRGLKQCTCAHFKCRHILHNYADKNNRKADRIVRFLLKFLFLFRSVTRNFKIRRV